MKPVTILASSIRLVLPLLLATVAAQAANSRWTGAAGDGLWTNPANWTAGVPGGNGTTSGDTAAFPTSTSTTITADAGRNIAELKFDNSVSTDGTGASSFTINGGPILFTAPGTLPTLHVLGMFGKNTETVNAPVQINGSTGNNDLLIATSNGFDGSLFVNGPISSAATSGTTSITGRAGLNSSIVLGGAISNGAGNVVKFVLATSNNGTVTMTGANSFTGGITVGNGTLVLDHSVNATVVNSAQPLTIGAGTLVVRGKASGTTALTLDATTGNDLTIPTLTGATLVVDRNGGAGTTLTLGSTWTRASGGTLLIDLSSGSTLTSSPTTLNSVVTAGTTAAGFWVKDATGTGFATVTSGNVVRYTGATALTGTGSATGNFKTTGGVLSGTTTFNTLEFDSSNAADSRILDIGANNLTPSGALGMLATGSNDFTVTGTGSINASSVFYQGSTGVFDLEVNLTGGFTKAGPGFMIVGKNTTQNFTMTGGITRFTSPNFSSGGNLAISTGAVMEIGTDMNGAATAGDFTRPIGTGATAFQIVGSGGFSAFGGTRVVNVGGASAAVNWGSAATDLLNGVFILSSERSDSTLEFQNPITLNGIDRAIQVNNGSADVDARLTGVLSSTLTAAGISKTGNGTLELTAANTYPGQTRVDGGRLLLTGSLSGTNALIIGNGASVKLNAEDALNHTAQLRLEGGSFLVNGHSATLGQVSITGSSTIDFGSGSTFLSLADSSTGAWSGTLSILNWSGTPEIGGGQDQMYFSFSSTGLTAAQLAEIQFVNPDNLPPGTYAAQMLGTGEVVASTTMVPEPGAWMMMGGGLALLLGAHRRRKE